MNIENLDAPPNELLGFDRISKANRYRKWIGQVISPHIGRRVLEVGSGIGNMTELFLDKELVVASDIKEEYLQIIKDKYSSHLNLKVDLLNLEKVDLDKYKRYCFDTIICINVLEHVEDDVRALKDLTEILVLGGRLIIFVPAVIFLYSAHDKGAGHYRRYTKKELIDKIKSTNLTIRRCFYFNFVGLLGWLFSSRILNRSMYSETHLDVFEAMVPLVSRIEKKIRIPFGLSLVAIGEKS